MTNPLTHVTVLLQDDRHTMRICRIMSHITKIRFWFSLRDYKDPDVHDAHSAQIRLAETFEIDLLCNIILLQSFMYTTFSMHIANKVLKKSDGIGSCLIELQPFSERISNCTNTLYSGEFSKYSCTPQFWVYPSRTGLLLGFDGVHGCKEHGPPFTLETFYHPRSIHTE